MTTSKNNTSSADLYRALHETTSLSQALLNEIQNNASSLTALQTKLESLGESVQLLSKIIRDDNGKGSMVTRLAILEREYEDLKQQIIDHENHDEEFEALIHSRVSGLKDKFIKDIKNEEDYNRETKLGYIKLIALSLPGVIALVIKLLGL